VNQKVGTFDPSVVLGNIHLVSYELLFPENVKPSMQMQILQNFSVFGLEKVVSSVVRGDLLTNSYLSGELVKARETSIYEIDGIICSSDAVYERKEKNPDHAFAFKMVLTDQVAEAKVVDVLWSPSKDGYLKPRVRIEPISLGGVCIEYATGFNAKFIRDGEIGVGAVVELIRSGDVIPHIRRVISVGGSGAKMPEGAYVWNETGVDILLSGADLDADLTVREKLVAGFFQGIDVVGLSSGLVARLISAGFDTVAKIVAMKMEDFMGIEGFQKKLATKIYEGIRKGLQKVGLIELMAASHLFGRGFGERKLRMILEEYPDVLVSSESKDEKWRRVLAIKGMAGKTAHVFVDGLEPFVQFLGDIGCLDKLQSSCKMEVSENNDNDELKGKTIVMTGFRDSGLEEELKKRGAKLGSTVTKNTFLVLVKENKKGEEKMTGKIKEAKELGITIMGLEEFLFHFHFHFLKKSGAKI
jgi:NAD-dependent DNA ligase